MQQEIGAQYLKMRPDKVKLFGGEALAEFFELFAEQMECSFS